MTDRWQLAEAVALRPEAFGGMAFHRERGVTLEVDAEAYRFLCAHRVPRPLPSPDHPAGRLVPQLVRLGILRPAEGGAESGRPVVQDSPWMGDGFVLSAPETVHLAITTRCNLNCPGCYVPRGGGGVEWTLDELRGLIDQWAQMRVFQLAVGGGEPLLYEGLFDVLAYARKQGLVPNLTTNGTLLTSEVVRCLEEAGVARVNVSWNGPDKAGKGRETVVRQALYCLHDSTLHVGVNLLVTPTLLRRLPQILARLQALGVRQVTILRPKPPAFPTDAGETWYRANRLRRADLLQLREVLNAWQSTLDLEVGSALVGLMGDADPQLLRWRGIHGCTAGRRMCTVWPDGRVTPCSFLGDLSAGDVRETPFAELWRRGEDGDEQPGHRRLYWEPLRDPAARSRGGCAGCSVLRRCGGAPCVARRERDDPFAGDVECPHYKQEDGKTTSLQLHDRLRYLPLQLPQAQRAV